MPYLSCAPDVGQPEPDEQASIDGIIKGMTQESTQVAARDGQTVRASHAKSTACVLGTLTVADGLPPELAQGLFARPGTYQVAVRFAQGPGERLGDRVSTHRGMAIKVFGAAGPKLPGHDAPTQDFVLATGPTFPAGTAAGFLAQAKKIGLSVPAPEGFKSAVSAAARVGYFDEAMTFSPAHSLVAHRPLGGVMRARLQVYGALSTFRHARTGVRPVDTAHITEIPA